MGKALLLSTIGAQKAIICTTIHYTKKSKQRKWDCFVLWCVVLDSDCVYYTGHVHCTLNILYICSIHMLQCKLQCHFDSMSWSYIKQCFNFIVTHYRPASVSKILADLSICTTFSLESCIQHIHIYGWFKMLKVGWWWWWWW